VSRAAQSCVLFRVRNWYQKNWHQIVRHTCMFPVPDDWNQFVFLELKYGRRPAALAFYICSDLFFKLSFGKSYCFVCFIVKFNRYWPLREQLIQNFSSNGNYYSLRDSDFPVSNSKSNYNSKKVAGYRAGIHVMWRGSVPIRRNANPELNWLNWILLSILTAKMLNNYRYNK